MNAKEHHIKDIVYFMHNNKPTKGVVVGECKQYSIQLDIKNKFDLIQCINSDYTAREHTMVSNDKFNKIVIINSNGGDDEYVPINDWISSNDIYDDVNDLFCSLLDTKL